MGPVACRGAGSLSSDGRGNTRCCPPGSSMQSFSGVFNGQRMNTCTCSRFLGEGGGFQFMGNNGAGGGFQFMGSHNNGGGFQFATSGGGNGYVDPNFNATAFAGRMQQWRQRFTQSMQNMANSLRRSLGGMFRNMWL